MTLPLPKVKAPDKKPAGKSALDRLRKCPLCGGDTRIVFNATGGTAYCGPCKRAWPIACPPNPMNDLPIPGRGISKQTIISMEPEVMDDPPPPPPDRKD